MGPKHSVIKGLHCILESKVLPPSQQLWSCQDGTSEHFAYMITYDHQKAREGWKGDKITIFSSFWAHKTWNWMWNITYKLEIETFLFKKYLTLKTFDMKWWNNGLTLCILMCSSTWNDTINLGWFIALTTKLFKQRNAVRMLNNGNDHDNSAWVGLPKYDNEHEWVCLNMTMSMSGFA